MSENPNPNSAAAALTAQLMANLNDTEKVITNDLAQRLLNTVTQFIPDGMALENQTLQKVDPIKCVPVAFAICLAGFQELAEKTVRKKEE